MVSIGHKIRYYRERRGYTQEKLAELAELSPNYLSALERGVKHPSLETFITIVNELRVPADVLLSDITVTGCQVESNRLYELIQSLPRKEQQRIFHVLDVMIHDAMN